MRRFVIASSMVYCGVGLAAIALGFEELRGNGNWIMSALLSAWVAPTLATWLSAEGLHVLSTRRLLDRRLSMPIRRIALGLLAGGMGTVLGVLGMAGLDRTFVPDAAITAVAAAIATLLVLLPTARVRKGVCLFCGYSHAGATPAARGVCVECGADLYAG